MRAKIFPRKGPGFALACIPENEEEERLLKSAFRHKTYGSISFVGVGPVKDDPNGPDALHFQILE